MAKTAPALKVLLSEDDREKLARLAHHNHQSMAECIRQSFLYRFAMQLETTPTCANGRICPVAALHTFTREKARFVENPTPEDEISMVGPPLPAQAAV